MQPPNAALTRFARAPFLRAAAGCDRSIGPDAIPSEALLEKVLQALGLSGRERVLEVGSRTGYETALLSHLAGAVISLSSSPETAKVRSELLGASGCHNVRVVVDTGGASWPLAAPYSAIVVTSGATHIPAVLLDQLENGGRLVIPLGDASGQLLELVRRGEGGFTSETLASCHFPMLPWASRRPSSFPWRRHS